MALKNTIGPNFLIIGAAKAATTSLASLLQYHPDAAIVKGKEPHFFSYDKLYCLGWERYQELYSHCTNELAIGDASTSYSRVRYHPEVIQRIKYHIPDVKIIYMVRHPLERMESAYVERLATAGQQTFSSISDAVTGQPMIVDSSRYWEVFDAYRQHFCEEQIKIVWFDEYVNNRNQVFQDICQFLGIDGNKRHKSNKESTNSRSNAHGRIKKLGRGELSINMKWNAAVRKRVIDEIRNDNIKFLQHFGKPSNYWGDLFE